MQSESNEVEVRHVAESILLDLTLPNQPTSPVAKRNLANFTNGLEEAMMVLGWMNAGCPEGQTDMPRLGHFYFVLSETIGPPEDDLGGFLDLLKQLHVTCDKLHDNIAPSKQELADLARVLSQMASPK